MALPPILPAPRGRGPALPPILPAPKARPVAPVARAAPANTATGANPRGVAVTAPPRSTVNDRQARTLATGNNPRGVAISQRPAGGKTLHQAIKDVFAHQNPVGQARILKGIQAGNADPVTARAVNEAVEQMSLPDRIALRAHLAGARGGGINLDKLLSEINPAKLFTSGLASGNATGPGVVPGSAAIQGATINYAKVGAQETKNFLKDAVTLPAQPFAVAGTVGGDVLGGHLGKAVSDVSPLPFIEHPKLIAQHPLDAYLTAAGVLHGVTRVAAGGVRAVAPRSAAGRAVGTTRPGIQLAGNLTHEQPRYSPYPLIKAGQKSVEAAKYERSPTGQLVPKSANVKAKLTGLETSRAIGVNERIRQANRDTVIAQRVKAIAPSLAAKAAHGAKTALKYNPDRAAIPGAGVLARVADATIRRPDTFKEDLAKHVQQVSANRANLLDFPKLLKEHDAYVKALSSTSKADHSPAELARLFKAAESYREDYQHVQDEAQGLGQFGSRSQDALLKRQLQHYAVSHMDATFDHEKGLLVDAQGRPLSNNAILKHLNGPEGTGGRIPAFTSDKAKQGSAFYISSERRPLPQNARNTLFAYTHGLTNPDHEALLEQHVRMQGIVDAHKAQNRLVSSSAIMKPDGKAWSSFSAAQKDGAPAGYVPIALSQPFHALDSLDKALEGTNPSDLEHEAMTHGLDLNARLTDTGQGRWGLVDPNVLKRINEHTAQISSNPTMRGFKMATNQFRQVALGTSAKHVPGVISETAIRSIANAEGISSWITGRRLINRATGINPELGKQAHVQLTGGTVAGMTRMMTTKQVSDHFSGTDLHGPLKAFESLMKAPGPRQVRAVWKAWLRLAINGTKKYVEEQSQTASLGKAALKDFASEHGPFVKAMRLQGQVLDDAAKGLFDPKKLRQLRAEIENVRGRWTDLTPTGQTALMFSPFGLWWVNSVKWLARSPIDRPLQTGAVASATAGTEKERLASGMDLFSPTAVPPYMQGGVPLSGGRVLAQNYYSPFGVANDFFQTLGSLVAPAVVPLVVGSLGDNYLGKPLNSPSDAHGRKPANAGQKAEYIANSLAGLFIPLYTKAEQIAQGGASAYDSANLPNLLTSDKQTKTPGRGVLAGVEKALTPYRMYHNKPRSQASNTYSIPKTNAAASGGQWNVVHSNPAGTGATGTTWKVAP